MSDPTNTRRPSRKRRLNQRSNGRSEPSVNFPQRLESSQRLHMTTPSRAEPLEIVSSNNRFVLSRILARATLRLAHVYTRVSTLAFSALVSGGFASFGSGSRLARPIHLVGTEKIAIGKGVYVGPGSALHSLSDSPGVNLSIGDGTRITGGCFIAAVHKVTIEAEVLMGKNVHIADHMHRYTQPGISVMNQGLDKVAPVVIRRGAWLGQGVIICPGVTIGEGAVIGANSVVNCDIESRSVAVGSPARVVKRIPSHD